MLFLLRLLKVPISYLPAARFEECLQLNVKNNLALQSFGFALFCFVIGMAHYKGDVVANGKWLNPTLKGLSLNPCGVIVQRFGTKVCCQEIRLPAEISSEVAQG